MTKFFENYDIKNETTFRIGGKVKKVAFPESIEEFVELLKSGKYKYVLGNCSNVLFSSNDIDENIILTKYLDKFEIGNLTVKVQCGALGPKVAQACQKESLSGFEFLVGFPGSFGGMICMNASAHNQAIADSFLSARIYDLNSNKILNFTKEQMQFDYRKSILSSGNYVVLDAVFKLTKGNPETIDEIVNRNIEFRKKHQPSLQFGNAGSIFKNPKNDSAGRLLDLCSMKNEKVGGAIVFQNHANFILNVNNATSTDVLNLMQKMQSKVKEKYRIELMPEIKFIGGTETKETEIWKTITENIQTIQK